MPKPETCRGCPLWGNGKGFVPDEIPGDGVDVAIVGQNPGMEEEAQGKPFVGATGEAMQKHYFPLAGLERGAVSIHNAIRCRYQSSNELPKLGQKDKVVERAIEHCQRAHFRIPSGTKLIVAQGEYALWALTGQRGITQWRGWMLPLKEGHGNVTSAAVGNDRAVATGVSDPLLEEGEVVCDRDLDNSDVYSGVYTPNLGDKGIPVLATLHLAALFRAPEMMLPTRLDWGKVPRYLAGKWPQKLPTIHTGPPKQWPRVAAFDTEFTYPGPKRLLRYNLCSDKREVYVVEANRAQKCVLSKPSTVIMHNAIADLDFLYNIVYPAHMIRVEDSMYANSVLWSGMGREDSEASYRGQGFGQGLEFLGSMYASINRWKHLSEVNPITYAAGDAVATLDLWENLQSQFENDVQSLWVYRNCVLPLLPIILEAEQRGLRVNRQRVSEVATELEAQIKDAELRAQAAVGWKISLASPQQVAHQLYHIEGIEHKKGR